MVCQYHQMLSHNKDNNNMIECIEKYLFDFVIAFDGIYNIVQLTLLRGLF